MVFNIDILKRNWIKYLKKIEENKYYYTGLWFHYGNRILIYTFLYPFKRCFLFTDLYHFYSQEKLVAPTGIEFQFNLLYLIGFILFHNLRTLICIRRELTESIL